jgi:hypothetical protein
MKTVPFIAAIVIIASVAAADKRLEGIACRSVHLRYDVPNGAAYRNAMTIETSAPGTYFCALGFDAGYFGLQELANGKKVVIFSVWDPGDQNDPNSVADDKRVKLVHKHPAVRTGRFGNEGTGGQSFLDYDWQIGQTYQFEVRLKPDGDRTEYAAYLYKPQEQAWTHLVTFSRPVPRPVLSGFYSFVEDFRRNRESTQHARRASFGPAQSRTGDDAPWTTAARARFTGDSNPVMNIDGGEAGGRFYLVTGGATTNTGTPLNKWIDLPAKTAQ